MNLIIYFIRHGENLSNAGGITMEHAAIPITERGEKEANIIADALNVTPALVLVSEHIRTQQTAQPFCEKHQCTAQTHPLLNEFSAISHELIEGMTGKERRPIADAYWAEANIDKRMRIAAETFTEFNERVGKFINNMPTLPDQTVIFGHGIWFGLLVLKLMEFDVTDSKR